MKNSLNIIKVVKVEVGPNGRKEKELKGKALKQWKIDHGYEVEEDDTTAEKTQFDTGT